MTPTSLSQLFLSHIGPRTSREIQSFSLKRIMHISRARQKFSVKKKCHSICIGPRLFWHFVLHVKRRLHSWLSFEGEIGTRGSYWLPSYIATLVS